MAQVVSHGPFTLCTRFRSRTSHVILMADEVTLGQFFLLVLLFSPVSIIPTMYRNQLHLTNYPFRRTSWLKLGIFDCFTWTDKYLQVAFSLNLTVPLHVHRKYNGTCHFAYRRPNRRFLTSEINWLIYAIFPQLCELCQSIDVHVWLRFDSLIPRLLVTAPLRRLKLNAVDCSHTQVMNLSGCWCQNVLLSFKVTDRTQSAVNWWVHGETKQLP
jgi:hypothetical protein